MEANNQEFRAENQQSALAFSLPPVKDKPLAVCYTGAEVSLDGGALLLREVEQRLGLIDKLKDCMQDERDPRYITHQLEEMLRQRIFQIACGYEDGNDCDALRSDAIFKLCAGKLPESQGDLASQPTMCRLENSLSGSQLYEMARSFVDLFIASYPEEPAMIILDCDDTNNDTYGDQQLSLFNQYYQEYCYMPLHIYEGLSGKLITTLLKPGRRSKNVDVFSLLRRIIGYLRQHWPDTIIILRGDSHFCSSPLMDWSVQQPNVHFVTGLAGNSKLKELSRLTVESAQRSFQVNQRKQKRYTSFFYQAQSWQHAQRVIAKIEVSEKGTNVRYIVTNMQHYRASHIYERAFCQRGSLELRIKEHKLYLKSDRSSCHRFAANQFRLFLHSAAYVLIHSLQSEVLCHTRYARATMKTIQLNVLKTVAWVKELKTKVKIELPRSFAHRDDQNRAFDILCLSG